MNETDAAETRVLDTTEQVPGAADGLEDVEATTPAPMEPATVPTRPRIGIASAPTARVVPSTLPTPPEVATTTTTTVPSGSGPDPALTATMPGVAPIAVATVPAGQGLGSRSARFSSTMRPITGAVPVAAQRVVTTRGPVTPVRSAGPRRVRLTVSRIDPWSVMKMSFLLAVAVGIMAVIATAVVWMVVDGLHVFATLQDFVNEALGQGTEVDVTSYFEFSRIISLTTLISVVNVVILTALGAIMAILYNITAALVGGVRVTLTDD